MSAVARIRKAAKRLIFGPPDYPQQVIVGMREPQSEIVVCLRGAGASCDVTRLHLMACASPFTVAIGTENADLPAASPGRRFLLEFRESRGAHTLLGEIRLRESAPLHAELRSGEPSSQKTLRLFQAIGSRNLCLPAPRIWARYAEYAYYRWRKPSPDVQMAARDVYAMCVFYTCPRPVGLVSVAEGDSRNIFPMNLMGEIGGGWFAFALNAGKPVTRLIERVRRIALCTVPFAQAQTAYSMAPNHKKDSIDISRLPFAVRPSAGFGFPVPEFALRVRELSVESIHQPGSHTLFLARLILDSPGPAHPRAPLAPAQPFGVSAGCESHGQAAVAELPRAGLPRSSPSSAPADLQFFTLHGIYEARRNPSPVPPLKE
jgi:flavin reductase (DIM6/NTAB) family NADH-FMN oxidoreductase RutF